MTTDQAELLVLAALDAHAFNGSMVQAIREEAEERGIHLTSNDLDRILLAANTRWASARKESGVAAAA